MTPESRKRILSMSWGEDNDGHFLPWVLVDAEDGNPVILWPGDKLEWERPERPGLIFRVELIQSEKRG